MKHSFLNFLSSALIPILRANVSAGTSCDVHLGLITVAAMGTFPHELAVGIIRYLDLAVKTADLAIVALGIELGVHNVVVDEFHNSEHSVDIVLHIGNLDVRDCAAGRELLELSLERKLCERVDRLGNVYVVGVGDVIFIGNTLNDTEAVLQTLSKLVGSALKGSAVERVIDILSSLPLSGVLVELPHNFKAELLTLVLGELLSVERVYALPKSRIAERKRGISAVEILVYLLTLLKSGERAILPKDGSGVGKCAVETLVTALERSAQGNVRVRPIFGGVPHRKQLKELRK